MVYGARMDGDEAGKGSLPPGTGELLYQYWYLTQQDSVIGPRWLCTAGCSHASQGDDLTCVELVAQALSSAHLAARILRACTTSLPRNACLRWHGVQDVMCCGTMRCDDCLSRRGTATDDSLSRSRPEACSSRRQPSMRQLRSRRRPGRKKVWPGPNEKSLLAHWPDAPAEAAGGWASLTLVGLLPPPGAPSKLPRSGKRQRHRLVSLSLLMKVRFHSAPEASRVFDDSSSQGTYTLG